MAGEATAEQELLVFFIELEDLQDPGATIFELGAVRGSAGGGGGELAQGGEGGIESLEQSAL